MCAGADETASWQPKQDAVKAAPENHRVVYEDAERRILEVTVRPGEREPLHHHQWPSVMVIDGYPSYVNYDAAGKEIRPGVPRPENPQLPVVARLAPQRAHAVENTGKVPFHAIRIEFKRLCAAKAGR